MLDGVHFVVPQAGTLTVVDRKRAVASICVERVPVALMDFAVERCESVPGESTTHATPANIAA